MTKFFLSSLESDRFEEVRECLVVKKMTFDTGKECAFVRLYPAVSGQPWGLAEDIAYFILATRHEGSRLFPINEFPCFVHIARPLKDHMEDCEVIAARDAQVVAWGELYRTREDATDHAFDGD